MARLTLFLGGCVQWPPEYEVGFIHPISHWSPIDEDNAGPARVRHLRQMDPLEIWVWGYHTSRAVV